MSSWHEYKIYIPPKSLISKGIWSITEYHIFSLLQILKQGSGKGMSLFWSGQIYIIFSFKMISLEEQHIIESQISITGRILEIA